MVSRPSLLATATWELLINVRMPESDGESRTNAADHTILFKSEKSSFRVSDAGSADRVHYRWHDGHDRFARPLCESCCERLGAGAHDWKLRRRNPAWPDHAQACQAAASLFCAGICHAGRRRL